VHAHPRLLCGIRYPAPSALSSSLPSLSSQVSQRVSVLSWLPHSRNCSDPFLFCSSFTFVSFSRPTRNLFPPNTGDLERAGPSQFPPLNKDRIASGKSLRLVPLTTTLIRIQRFTVVFFTRPIVSLSLLLPAVTGQS
jgi:hypothetical protein